MLVILTFRSDWISHQQAPRISVSDDYRNIDQVHLPIHAKVQEKKSCQHPIDDMLNHSNWWADDKWYITEPVAKLMLDPSSTRELPFPLNLSSWWRKTENFWVGIYVVMGHTSSMLQYLADWLPDHKRSYLTYKYTPRHTPHKERSWDYTTDGGVWASLKRWSNSLQRTTTSYNRTSRSKLPPHSRTQHIRTGRSSSL